MSKSKKPTKSRGKSKPRRKPPPRMVIRRNAAPAATETRNAARRRRTVPPRQPIGYRVKQMSGSHVAAGIGAGSLANVLGVLAVGKQWVGPKTTAGILMGTGTLASAAGWYWDADHMMAAGAGVAAAGTFSLANQFAVDVYEAAEKKAGERRAEREKQEREKQLEAARKLIAEEAAKQQRNGPAFRIVRSPDTAYADDDDIDDRDLDDEDNDAAA